MSTKAKIYPNMDIVRYLLAFAVLIAHFNELAGHDIPFIISSYNAVGGFFALSGFLMYRSYTKHNNAVRFALMRARRILPPYLITVVFFALALAAASTLPLASYFGNSDFYKYLAANISFMNWLSPCLPGVFAGDEFVSHAVNGSLWTMKVEWMLYFTVPVFVWLASRLRGHKIIIALAIIAMSVIYRFSFTLLYQETGRELFNILGRQIFGQLSFFYTGMLIYFLKEHFMRRLPLYFILALVLETAAIFIPYGRIFILPFAISTIVMALSLYPRSIKLPGGRHNISYEIYLVHYPIVQLCVATHLNQLPQWSAFGITALATIVAAALLYAVCRTINSCAKSSKAQQPQV
ncbi:MAG: acyltransferase [Muribaculaceae bacterium]|nr:acyltransferase [Muribaculaceae bacterium]